MARYSNTIVRTDIETGVARILGFWILCYYVLPFCFLVFGGIWFVHHIEAKTAERNRVKQEATIPPPPSPRP